jgi:hypothetical protein
MTGRLDGFTRLSIAKALEYAGLEQGALKSGAHPDDGGNCLYMRATIQQYSAFLAALAVQYRTADGTAPITGRVRLDIDNDGDSRFWFPEMQIRERWIPGARSGE